MGALNTPAVENLKYFRLLKYFSYLGSCWGDQSPVMKTDTKYLKVTQPTDQTHRRSLMIKYSTVQYSTVQYSTVHYSPTCDTSCSRGSGLYHGVSPVTLEHDLSPVLDLPHVGPVLVEAHVPHQEDLPVLHEAGEGTVDWK